jgi:hypothetical protein
MLGETAVWWFRPQFGVMEWFRQMIRVGVD